ncbi:hypothetical protein PTTW11_03141 [Pyrenophora teres f. teres]|uniref:Uncharacterized protein n=1 Tax=Pyrenophora teres f. teres TaxID=97479 RepID=A0A6S6VLC6_9PLEO|nr:hypothetical protein PTTW11_03141 [Pyrenophora teres f. teres]
MKYFFPILVGTLATLLPSAIAEKVCTPCSPGRAVTQSCSGDTGSSRVCGGTCPPRGQFCCDLRC